jgi:lipopolysaccharide transport system ATP-binding protein
MSDAIITVEKLAKCYRLGAGRSNERYTALRDVITDKAKSLFRRTPLTSDVRPLIFDDFWALKDVSFEVKQGEVIGIIGRNGAGKSTLLKILSRITEPTEGMVRLKGRVASLLEVGTGFHPELTGRENVFLNGAILGMTRREIIARFDEIVAFAEVEKFLDTPVKRYSSGMYVRLAFAVAAHLEPEILVVDEVLAVGDAEFQKKCLGKMKEASKAGRTVLFVSHNMAAVQGLCMRGLLLQSGQITFDGSPGDAVKHYLGSDLALASLVNKKLSETIVLTSIECFPPIVQQYSSLQFRVTVKCLADEVISDMAIHIESLNGQRAALIDLRSLEGPFRVSSGMQLNIQATVTHIPFVENDYAIGFYINADSVCSTFNDLSALSVLPKGGVTSVTPREPQFRGIVELQPRIRAEIVPCSGD